MSNQRLTLAVFKEENDLIGGVKAIREKGLKIVDVFSPYAVHGLDRALGWKTSRLTWACFFFGLTGVAIMTGFQFWSSAVDWPLNIGGKPFNSLPAFIPLMFEGMILFAGLGVVFSFFLISKLWPGKSEGIVYPGVTDDTFVVVIDDLGSKFSTAEVKDLLEKHNVFEIKEQDKGELSK